MEVGQCWIFKEITKNKKADGELVQWAVVVALRCFSDGTFPSVALFNYGESRQRGFLIKNCVSETSHPHFIVFLALFFWTDRDPRRIGKRKKIMSNLLFWPWVQLKFPSRFKTKWLERNDLICICTGCPKKCTNRVLLEPRCTGTGCCFLDIVQMRGGERALPKFFFTFS